DVVQKAAHGGEGGVDRGRLDTARRSVAQASLPPVPTDDREARPLHTPPQQSGPVGDGPRGDLSHPFLPDLSTGIRASQGSILEDETELLPQLVHRIRRRSLRSDYGPINIVLRRAPNHRAGSIPVASGGTSLTRRRASDQVGELRANRELIIVWHCLRKRRGAEPTPI